MFKIFKNPAKEQGCCLGLDLDFSLGLDLGFCLGLDLGLGIGLSLGLGMSLDLEFKKLIVENLRKRYP
jgi:hypothetical protein